MTGQAMRCVQKELFTFLLVLCRLSKNGFIVIVQEGLLLVGFSVFNLLLFSLNILINYIMSGICNLEFSIDSAIPDNGKKFKLHVTAST